MNQKHFFYIIYLSIKTSVNRTGQIFYNMTHSYTKKGILYIEM